MQVKEPAVLLQAEPSGQSSISSEHSSISKESNYDLARSALARIIVTFNMSVNINDGL